MDSEERKFGQFAVYGLMFTVIFYWLTVHHSKAGLTLIGYYQ